MTLKPSILRFRPSPRGLALVALLIAIAGGVSYLVVLPDVRAQSGTDPKVRIVSVEPMPVSEDHSLRVTLGLKPPIHLIGAPLNNEIGTSPICPHGTGTDDDEADCIEGGILVFDSHNDSIDGKIADVLIAFVFRSDEEAVGEQLNVLTYRVPDACEVIPDRNIEIQIHQYLVPSILRLRKCFFKGEG